MEALSNVNTSSRLPGRFSYHTLAGLKMDITSVTFAVFGIPFEAPAVLSRPLGAGESIAMGVDDIWTNAYTFFQILRLKDVHFPFW